MKLDTRRYPLYGLRALPRSQLTTRQRLGEKLRVLRLRHNLSLRELASRLGYTAHGYINAVEKGHKKPSIEFVIAIAQLFQVSTDQILNDTLELDVSHTDSARAAPPDASA